MKGTLIRKLSVGSDINNQLHIAVGSTMAGSVIDFIKYTGNGYTVYTKDENKQIKAWKRIENMPVIIEYDTRLE